MPALLTTRLRLMPMSLDVVEALLRRDREGTERAVDTLLATTATTDECARHGAELPDDWPSDQLIARAFPYSLDAIRADPDTRLWGDSLIVPRTGPARIVGSVIFHGRPASGIAEVGYGVAEDSRGQGLATEATLACVEWALTQPGITAVHAVTFPWHVASLGVIRKLGMTEVGKREHDVLGELRVFERRRG